MRLMKNSALSLTLVLLVIVFFASSCANNKRYQTIGCYSYNSIPPSDKNDFKIVDFCEFENDMNLATQEILPVD